jgi:hypothetical protein
MRRVLVALTVLALCSACVMDVKKKRRLIAAGALTFAGGYAASVLTGTFYYSDEGNPSYFVPVVGPIAAAATYDQPTTDDDYYYYDASSSSGPSTRAWMYVWAVPLATSQALGLFMLVSALISPATDEVQAPQAPAPVSEGGDFSVAPLPGGGQAIWTARF